ncbi:MAG: ABC transporter permease [Solibacillus sp.]|uniref:ABC transporter permease n=1 Tax=unclassified Solibacillus TaxID=2637870 RepID=UPI003100B8F2
MKKFVFKKIVNIVLTLFAIATLTFFLMKMLPGSPFDEEALEKMTDEARIEFLARYGLDQPLYVQYAKYIGNILQGDFGTSYYFKGQDVTALIMDRIVPSAFIGLQAVLLGLFIGLILGMIAAMRHNSGWDYTTMFISVLGVSVPNFVIAAILQYYVGLKLGILPIAFWEGYSSSIMPTLALSFGVVAMVARFMRNEMLDVLSQDYMLTAKAKGIGQGTIVVKHAIRNALIPVVTIIGPIFVNLLTGSLVIENIFSVPGIGSLFVDSIKMNDYTTIMGLTLFYSLFFILTMLIVDLLYGILDPRIRLKETKE